LSVDTPRFVLTIASSWPSTACDCDFPMDATVLAARSLAPCSSSTPFSVESWPSSKLALSLELEIFLAYLEEGR
jgi:hypothetical protein